MGNSFSRTTNQEDNNSNTSGTTTTSTPNSPNRNNAAETPNGVRNNRIRTNGVRGVHGATQRQRVANGTLDNLNGLGPQSNELETIGLTYQRRYSERLRQRALNTGTNAVLNNTGEEERRYGSRFEAIPMEEYTNFLPMDRFLPTFGLTTNGEETIINSMIRSAMTAITTAAHDQPPRSLNEQQSLDEERRLIALAFMDSFLNHLQNGSPTTQAFPTLALIPYIGVEDQNLPNEDGTIFRAFQYHTPPSTTASNRTPTVVDSTTSTTVITPAIHNDNQQIPILIIGIRSAQPANNDHRRSWVVYVIGSNYGQEHPIVSQGIPENISYDRLMDYAQSPLKPKTTTLDKIKEKYGGFLVGSLDLKEECLICLEEFQCVECRKLSCFHVFHAKCIDKWLTVGSNTCPLCRDEAVPIHA